MIADQLLTIRIIINTCTSLCPLNKAIFSNPQEKSAVQYNFSLAHPKAVPQYNTNYFSLIPRNVQTHVEIIRHNCRILLPKHLTLVKVDPSQPDINKEFDSNLIKIH